MPPSVLGLPIFLFLAARVVDLQNHLPRARVVYCSATSVSEPQNFGFMSRLGLWGAGTEHAHFNQWLDAMHGLGTGAIELNAMHLKSVGALQARQLSYETCDFALINVVSDAKYTKVYESASNLWVRLFAELSRRDMKRADYWAGELIQWFPFSIITNYLVLTLPFISNVQNRASQIFSTTGDCI